jgi:hypothetical protein
MASRTKAKCTLLLHVERIRVANQASQGDSKAPAGRRVTQQGGKVRVAHKGQLASTIAECISSALQQGVMRGQSQRDIS